MENAPMSRSMTLLGIVPFTALLRSLLTSLAVAAPALAQCPKTQINGTQWQMNEYFGTHLALSADVLVAGSPGYQGAFQNQGSAKVFYLDGAQLSLGAQLFPSDPKGGASFGSAVALDGLTAVVSALGNFFVPSAVYVFERTTSGWQQLARLDQGASSWAQLYGASVALNSEWLFVGAPNESSMGPKRGAVYVYQRSGATWTQVDVLHSALTADYLGFGSALAVDGDRLVVGAPGTSPSEQSPPWTDGGVDAFRLVAGQWVHAQFLPTPLPGAPNQHPAFGIAVDLEGDRLVVGAPWGSSADGYLGRVYEYRDLGQGWVAGATIVEPESPQSVSSSFAYEFALSGARLLIGSAHDLAGGGLAYLYEHVAAPAPGGSSWELRSKVQPYGYGIALTDERGAVGIRLPPSSTYSGAVQLFPSTGSGCAPLLASPSQAGALSANTLSFALDAGLASGGRPYVLLGTLAGQFPGLQIDGLHVPLNPDGLFWFGLTNPGSGLYSNSHGVLDAQGRADASMHLPGGLGFLLGHTLTHAYAVLDLTQGLAVTFVSNPSEAPFAPF
jgi:hypothetical protein